MLTFLTAHSVLIAAFANIMLVVVTLLLYIATKRLKDAADMQFVSAMATAFQNEWHDRSQVFMRDYLQSEEGKAVLGNVIKDAYGEAIPLENCQKLLSGGEDENRLRTFESTLRATTKQRPLSGEPVFSAYEALYRVLLSFDRLAVIQYNSQILTQFVAKYSPPIKDLAPVLQAFIAVRIRLRPEKQRNYKKDYMLLLVRMGVANPVLFAECEKRLNERHELTSKEVSSARAFAPKQE